MQLARAGSPRRALPLAITAALHALLAGLWMATSTRPASVGGTQPALRLLWITPAAPKAAPLPKTRKPVQASPLRQSPAAPTQPAAPASVAAEPVTDAVPEAAPRPSAAGLLDAARQAAGTVDRELRATKQAPLQGNGAWGRFESQLAAAKVNTARGVSTETYVSPDGTVTYRTRNGGKVYCRRSGGVAPGLEPTQGQMLASGGAIGGLTTAGNVRCPTQEPGFRP